MDWRTGQGRSLAASVLGVVWPAARVAIGI